MRNGRLVYYSFHSYPIRHICARISIFIQAYHPGGWIAAQPGCFHVQDGKGFIWDGYFNGLQRYDGSRFIYYPEMLSNPAEELTNGAEIYADNKNNLL